MINRRCRPWCCSDDWSAANRTRPQCRPCMKFKSGVIHACMHACMLCKMAAMERCPVVFRAQVLRSPRGSFLPARGKCKKVGDLSKFQLFLLHHQSRLTLRYAHAKKPIPSSFVFCDCYLRAGLPDGHTTPPGRFALLRGSPLPDVREPTQDASLTRSLLIDPGTLRAASVKRRTTSLSAPTHPRSPFSAASLATRWTPHTPLYYDPTTPLRAPLARTYL